MIKIVLLFALAFPGVGYAQGKVSAKKSAHPLNPPVVHALRATPAASVASHAAAPAVRLQGAPALKRLTVSEDGMVVITYGVSDGHGSILPAGSWRMWPDGSLDGGAPSTATSAAFLAAVRSMMAEATALIAKSTAVNASQVSP